LVVSVYLERIDTFEKYLRHNTQRRRKNPGLHAQVGAAILGTTCTSSSDKKLLRTFNFGIGDDLNKRRKVARRVLHGTPMKWIEMEDIRNSLEGSIDRTRDIVLIGHGYQGYLTILRELGFNLTTSVVAILDTQDLARPEFGPKSLKLSVLLSALEISHDKLHNAGNDAYYTLQVCLALIRDGGGGNAYEVLLGKTAIKRLKPRAVRRAHLQNPQKQ
jgi:DNA polymerase III epsilon subunit-like protein